MIIFSHRGLGFGLPENILFTYEYALKQGFSLEIDVQTTKDKRLVISHDQSLMGQFGLDKQISDMNFEEVRKLKGVNKSADYPIQIPSFEEALTLFDRSKTANQKLAIHFKENNPQESLRLTVHLIKDYGLENSTLIFDLSLEAAKIVKSINDSIRIGLSVAEKRYFRTIYLWEDVKKSNYFDIVWWDEWQSGLYNKRNFSAIRRANKPIYAISPELHNGHPSNHDMGRIKNCWRKLKNLGIEGICTDYPKDLEGL